MHAQNTQKHHPLADAAKVVAALEATQSVSLAAAMLGVTVQRLSKWLHRQKRAAWWEAQKNAWRTEARRMRQWRKRERAARRDGRPIKHQKNPHKRREVMLPPAPGAASIGHPK